MRRHLGTKVGHPTLKKLAPKLALAPALLLSVGANAFDFELDVLTGSWTTTVGYGVAWQTSASDSRHIGIANGGRAQSVNFDDGHVNFRNNNGTPITRAFTVDSALELNWGNLGMYASGRYLYDSRNDDKNLHPERDVRNEIGEKAELLDAYVSYLFELPNRSLALRVGSQRLNWGEAKTLTHGVLELNPLNASRFRKPGADLREVIEPIPMIFGSLDLTDNLALDAFYQLDWRRTEPDPAGAFFSSNDFAAIGGQFIVAAGGGTIGEPETYGEPTAGQPGGPPADEPADAVVVPRAGDRNPDDDGQWGAKLSYYAAQLNGTEFGLYVANYHSRRPLYSGISTVGGSIPTGRYFSEYPEDIELAGISFNTQGPWGLAVSGEFTYRRGLPLQVDDVELLLPALGITSQASAFPGEGQYIQGFRRFNYTQYALNFIKSLNHENLFAADSMVMLLELGAAHVHNMPSQDELRLSGPGTYCRGGSESTAAGLCLSNKGFPTASAWGYRFAMSWQYNNVFSWLNVKPKMLWVHDVNGTTPDPLVLFVEHRRQITVGAEFELPKGVTVELGYTDYFGGAQQNTLNDRDLFTASAQYTF